MSNLLKNHKISAVLFDLDGTLLDTAPDLGAALNHVLLCHDKEAVSYEDYRVESSNGSIGLLKLGFGEELKKFDVEALRTMLLQHYEENLHKHTSLFSGIGDYLNWLNDRKIPWGIVTNKPGYLTDKLIPAFPELNKCQVCYSADTFKNRKPHPEPLLKAAKALKAAPANTLYIGDAQRDMEAAQRADMISVLAKYGYLTPEEIAREWQVDFVVHSPDELINIHSQKP